MDLDRRGLHPRYVHAGGLQRLEHPVRRRRGAGRRPGRGLRQPVRGHRSSYTGSLTAPASTERPDGSETAGSDSAEQAALKAVATVTPAQAEHAATAAVPGTVAESDLGNENGFVFYSVEVNGSNGTVTEVIVDAGNGAVLAQQAQDARDAADAPDQPESATDAPD